MEPLSVLKVDDFASEAHALRAHFDERFADPRLARGDRFVWDMWHVPGQYSALRTPAWEYFPKKIYDAFHQRLVWWGRRTLGCHDVSPPWMSNYINGCEQRLHGDLPHGQFAFVFSLTHWKRRTFRGGETMLLRDDVLDFWQQFASVASVEENEVIRLVEPRFNRLTVFDPRIPHGVRKVEGTMDPREGRLVIHGWFVQPRPFIQGPIREKDLATQIERVSEHIAPRLEGGLPIAGMLSLRIDVRPNGTVAAVTQLANTVRSPSSADAGRRALLKTLMHSMGLARFSKHAKPSQITVPFVFERAA